MAKSENIIRRRDSRRRFSAYCDEWLLMRRRRVKESTYIKYGTALDRHIKPRLGGIMPQAIGTAAIDGFARALAEEDGLAPKTVHDILNVLHAVLKYTAAQLPGVVAPVDISYPRRTRQEMRVLSREEQRRFVEYLLEDMDACKFGVLLALLTGMRIGEVCALQWDCVPEGEGCVRVAATMQRLHDTESSGGPRTRIVIGPPKSDSSARTIPLTDYAAALCDKMRPSKGPAYVLTGTEAFMEPRTLQYRMEKYTRECGLEGVHFHTLRHTFATRAVEVGFEIKSLSEVLGHASTTITLDRYVHSSMELKRRNMSKLAAIGF